MNEYLVEDEYSFYEIDPECKIGREKGDKQNESLWRTEQTRNRGKKCSNCSWLLLYMILKNLKG